MTARKDKNDGPAAKKAPAKKVATPTKKPVSNLPAIGRRPKLTEELVSIAYKTILTTSSHKSAAARMGISESCFQKWLATAREIREAFEEDEEYELNEKETLLLQFLQLIELGLTKIKEDAFDSMIKASRRGDWRAGESILNRRFRDEFGDGRGGAFVSEEDGEQEDITNQTGVMIVPGPMADFDPKKVIEQQKSTMDFAARRLAELEAEMGKKQ